MLVLDVDNSSITFEVSREDGRFWLLLRDFGINPDGVTDVIVKFFREPLTEEQLYAKITQACDDARHDRDDNLRLFPE